MECPRCINPFGESYKTPRILPKCGHSLCSDCIALLWNDKKLVCPNCDKISVSDSPEEFPINQALLQIAASRSQLCQTHNRPFEAYCKDDRKLMCVRCLLESNHRSCQVSSIADEAHKERDLLRNLQFTALQIEESMMMKQENLKEIEIYMNGECQRVLEEYQDLYDMVRSEVNKRETEITTKIREILKKAESELREKAINYKKHLYLIETLKQEIEKSEAEKDIEVLIKVTEREAVIKAATSKVEPINKAQIFIGFSKDEEAQILGKLLTGILGYTERLVNVQTIIKELPNKEPDTESSVVKTSNLFRSYPFNSEAKQRSKAQTMRITTQSRYIKDKSPVTVRSSLDKSDWNKNKFKGVAYDFSPSNTNPIREPYSAKVIIENDDDKSSVYSLDIAAFCKVPHSNIYNFGGFSESCNSKVEIYDSTTQSWKDLSENNNSRIQFATVFYHKKILALGGKIRGKIVDTCEEYDRFEDLWRSSEISLTSVRSGFGTAITSDDIYVVGGSDGVPLKTAEVWKGNRWSTINSMKLRRDELSISMGPDNHIYAIGGYGGPDMTSQSSAERYNIKEGTWSFLPSMKESRRAFSSVTLPDGLYVFGGFDGSKYLSSMEKYDIRTGRWVQLCPMNNARCSLSGVTSNDCQYIYAIGGFNGIGLRTVERYSVVDNSWQEVPLLNSPRFSHCSLIFNE